MDRIRTVFGKRTTPPRKEMAQPSAASPREAQERLYRRQRAYKGAEIHYDKGLMSCPCRVIDISDAGARLTFANDLALPHAFTLTIALDGVEVDCAMAWYDRRQMGVKFVSPMRKVSPRRAQSVQSSDARRGPRLRSIVPVTPAEEPPAQAPKGLVASLPEVSAALAANIIRFPGAKRRQ
ncbi:PilZ domain-containing protein [Futiania mangrovi]|uniref:PilZ domain-containing protein n=1 Tax=Futiania mangrovi TaxID=2959716 RepID=A0A9J6PCB2_9PROT|nr:PilZ domain-containing protein [Futiania mangrovii]MCP1336941.1 PilZ domain-containing protein [Futiania mangrovii]